MIRLITFTFLITLLFTSFHVKVDAKDGPLLFNDLDNSKWAWDSIYYLTGQNVINGYGGGKFGPTEPLTRGQAATILVRDLYAGVSATSSSPFPDVKQSHMFYNEILVAAEKGIFGGTGDGTFKPNAPIDRGAVAKILAIAYDLKKGSTKVNFKDVKGHWSAGNIDILASNKIINGYTNGTFLPDKKVTRAEFAKMLTETLVHKDPMIWVTPELGTWNSYVPDPKRSYTFTDNYGGYTLEFVGFDQLGNTTWHHVSNDTTYNEEFSESKDGAVRLLIGQDQLVDNYLTYPLFVGKTWRNIGVNYTGDILNTITSLNATVETPLRTFNNAIEVTDTDGFLRYFAKGYGHIGVFEKTPNGMEPHTVLSGVQE